VRHSYIEVSGPDDKLDALERFIRALFSSYGKGSAAEGSQPPQEQQIDSCQPPHVLVFVDRAPKSHVREGTTTGTQYDPLAVGARLRSGIETAGMDTGSLVRYCLDDMAAAARIQSLRQFK
jgi:hypothetical protein